MVCCRQPRSADQGWGNLFRQLFYTTGLKFGAAEGSAAQQLISKDKEPSCTGSSINGVKGTEVLQWNTPTIDLFVIQVWDFVLTPCLRTRSVNLQLFPKLRLHGTDEVWSGRWMLPTLRNISWWSDSRSKTHLQAGGWELIPVVLQYYRESWSFCNSELPVKALTS